MDAPGTEVGKVNQVAQRGARQWDRGVVLHK